MNERISIVKQMCHQLLNYLNHENKNLISNYIEQTSNIKTINIVFDFLSSNYVFGKNATYESLMNKIRLNDEMISLIK